jgi:hypothetical protein
MAVDSPLAHGPAPAEQPTPDAELRIQVIRIRTRDPSRRLIPPEQADYAIMTSGVLGSMIIGSTGMILTLRIAPGLPGIALAELIFAVMAVFVIAMGRRSRGIAGSGQQMATGSKEDQPDDEA